MKQKKALICVPVCSASVEALAREVALAATTADLIELRLDCLTRSEFEESAPAIKVAQETGVPLIVTLRPVSEGGHRELPFSERKTFWSTYGESLSPALLDLELDLVHSFAADPPPGWDWDRVICSHHDFRGVPAELESLYERMAATPARILKIAVQAHDAVDCLPLFALLDRAGRAGRELIAIAIGPSGIPTRVLGPAAGGFLTYGAMAPGRGTADGQLTARDLGELYRIQQIDRETLITGLLGFPVGHSVSPHIHNAAFASRKMNAVYLPFAVRDVSGFIKRMLDPRTRELYWRLHGLSVTAPHKVAVMDHLDWIEPSAQEIGAVNTIVVADQTLRGYNTDALAVLQPVIDRLGSIRDARCAVIGAGGVASAALWSLRNVGAHTTLFARDAQKGQALADKFGARFESLGRNRWAGFDVLIHATPLGTLGDLKDSTVATADQLQDAGLVYDLVYNPLETRFMREARGAGCEAIGGLPMLVLQAAEQFRLWTNEAPPLEVMHQAANRAFVD